MMRIPLTQVDVSPQPLRVTTPELDYANPSLQTHILVCSAIAENCYRVLQHYLCAASLLCSIRLSVTLAPIARSLLPPNRP